MPHVQSKLSSCQAQTPGPCPAMHQPESATQQRARLQSVQTTFGDSGQTPTTSGPAFQGIRSDVKTVDLDSCHFHIYYQSKLSWFRSTFAAALRRATFTSLPDSPQSGQFAPSSKSPVSPYGTPPQPYDALRGDSWLPGGARKYVQLSSLRQIWPLRIDTNV